MNILKSFFLVVIVLLSLNLKSLSVNSTPFIDSLKTAAINEKNDSIKELLYEKIAITYNYSIIDYDSAIFYFKNSARLLVENKYKLCKRYGEIALTFNYKYISDSAFTYSYKSIEIARKNNYKDLEGTFVGLLGTYFQKKSTLDSALICYLRSYEILDSISYDKMERPLVQLTNIYSEMGDYIKAKKYAILHKNISEKKELKTEEDTISLAFSYNNLSTIYSDLKQFDSAKTYLLKSHKVRLSLKDESMLVVSYNNLGNYYCFGIRQIDTGIHYFMKAIDLSEKFNNYGDLTLAYANLGIIFYQQSKYNKAYDYFKKVEQLSYTHGIEKNILLDTYMNLMKINLLQSNIEESSLYFSKYDSLNDVLYNEEKTKSLLEVETKYKVSEKEKENAELKKEKVEQDLAIQKNKTRITTILSVTGLFILLALFYYFKQKNKTEKQVLNLKNQALRLQINPHFFFNAMNSINKYIGANEPAKAKNYLTKFSKVMRLSLESVQEENIPLQKEVDFLTNYLEIEKLRHKNFEYIINIDDKIEADEIMIPPIIIQPFVENSVLHGFINKTQQEKGNLEISFTKKEKNIQINISDNGIGIIKTKEIKSQKNHKSLALTITQKRLDIFAKKKTKINFSSPNDSTGTIVDFNLPIINFS